MPRGVAVTGKVNENWRVGGYGEVVEQRGAARLRRGEASGAEGETPTRPFRRLDLPMLLRPMKATSRSGREGDLTNASQKVTQDQ